MKPLDFSHLKISKPKKRTKDRQPALFKPDFSLVKEMRCPKTLNRLYWNISETILRCPKKGCSFVLTAQKYHDIVSGKTLSDYKKFHKEITK